jgi:hypothetical protein
MSVFWVVTPLELVSICAVSTCGGTTQKTNFDKITIWRPGEAFLFYEPL